QQYVADERALLFDYRKMAPGKICYVQEELHAALSEPDTPYWTERRKEVRDMVFDHCDDQAGTRLLDYLQSNTVKT
ncbi:MAG: CDP-glycerol glycerophosphotransferase family protein, partial [Thermodesulfobacteriota bacterium]|nr:CDP-glycerol glycerophosphotransferase family protein [Thermodesulfobacteriota bacterium]